MSLRSQRWDLQQARDRRLQESIRVSLPVRVLSFDAATMTVDVQPLIKEVINDQSYSATMLTGIPVLITGNSDFLIRSWYNRGDVGIILISDKDMNAVILSGTEKEPATKRIHALEDAVFIGGIRTDNQPKLTKYPPESIVIASGDTYIAVGKSGIVINGDVTITGSLIQEGENG